MNKQQNKMALQPQPSCGLLDYCPQWVLTPLPYLISNLGCLCLAIFMWATLSAHSVLLSLCDQALPSPLYWMLFPRPPVSPYSCQIRMICFTSHLPNPSAHMWNYSTSSPSLNSVSIDSSHIDYSPSSYCRPSSSSPHSLMGIFSSPTRKSYIQGSICSEQALLSSCLNYQMSPNQISLGFYS